MKRRILAKKYFSYFLTVLIISILCLAGCAPTVPPRPELTQEVPTLDQNLSRVYFFNGNFYTTWTMDLNSKGGAGYIYIDKSNVGMINKREYVVIDLPPGNHEMYWQPEMDDKHKSIEKSMNLVAGQTYYLSANMRDSGSKAHWFGLIGVMVADVLYVDTLDEAPLSKTSTRLVDYKVLNKSRLPLNTNPTEKSATTPNKPPLKNDNKPGSEYGSVYDRLDKLKELYKKELITKDEYDKERQELLDEL